MPGIRIKLDVNEAKRASEKLRKELRSLGSEAASDERQFKKLETRLHKGMKADKAKKSIDQLKGSIKLTRLETARLQHQVGDTTGAMKTMVLGNNDAIKSFATLGTAIAAAAVAAGYAMVRLTTESIAAASALEEVSSKYAVVFEGQTATVDKWADTLVEKYAMSTRESKKYLSSIQDLLVPMGMQSQAAAVLSNEIVKLAADLGSFNDLPTEQVMLNIQSALVGEYESMKKYGVILNKGRVEQEAMNMGLADTAKNLTLADRAQGAYRLMVKSSTAAIGDMDRTADGYANTSKRLNAEWEDFTSTLGNGFLPTATKVKGSLADILDLMTKIVKGPGDKNPLVDMANSIEKQIAMLERAGLASVKTTPQFKALLANLKSIKDVQEDSYDSWGKWTDGIEDVEKSLEQLSLEAIRVDNALDNFFGDIDEKEAALKSFGEEAQRTAEALKDVWGNSYDIDYGTDEVQASIDKMLLTRNNEALAIKTNIDLQNRMALAMDDTYDVDFGAVTDGLYDLEDVAEDAANTLEDAFSGWANSYASTLNDMLWGSEFTFSSVAESFGKMVTEMIIQQELIKPFLSMTSGFSVGGALSSAGSFVSDLFHDGGVVGSGEGGSRSVSPAVFSGAPRFHSGLLPDEFPAILQKGEGVFTSKQMAAMGGNQAPNVLFKISNNGEPVSAKQQGTPQWDEAGRQWVIGVVMDAVERNDGRAADRIKAKVNS